MSGYDWQTCDAFSPDQMFASVLSDYMGPVKRVSRLRYHRLGHFSSVCCRESAASHWRWFETIRPAIVAVSRVRSAESSVSSDKCGEKPDKCTAVPGEPRRICGHGAQCAIFAGFSVGATRRGIHSECN
jgi:hypothetical protein